MTPEERAKKVVNQLYSIRAQDETITTFVAAAIREAVKEELQSLLEKAKIRVQEGPDADSGYYPYGCSAEVWAGIVYDDIQARLNELTECSIRGSID